MKKLVNPAELALASHLRPGDPRVALLAEVSGLKRLERFYNEIEQKPGEDFITALFTHLDLHLEVSDEDLALIPRTGGVVIVANHPYGAIDGLALLNVLERTRPDIKVMANFMLQQLEPLRDRFIGVNPFEQLTSRSSFHGMRQAMEHLAQGRALGVFPAGEVSSYRSDVDAVADPRWKAPVIKLIRNAQVPVVPMWFDGANSLVFQMLGMIHPNLRTLRLPNEMLRMRGRSVRMRIGKPILPKDLAALGPVEQVAKYLRAKTYALGSGAPVKREQFKPLRFPRRPKPIVEPESPSALAAEIATLEDRKLSEQGEFTLYLAQSGRIPHILREIGRLREVTFRAVGEGTNKPVDLDEFDHYYDHLFLWDRSKQKIVGAYRIGDGRMIMERYGKRGLYTSTLFRMGRAMHPILKSAFELGRSFVAEEYQKHRLPLFLLWRGLLLHITSHPDHRYLIGPVSISSEYSRFSRSLIMDFVQQHHYDHELAAHVKPRNRFHIVKEKADGNALLEASGEDMRKLDKLISDIETSGSAVPVLLKKYLLLNARIIGFNSDPRFNDALDGLMLLDLTRLPPRTVEDLSRGMA
ncbi:MAG TPA: lysophospholipid acyltransferase family protein [Flavobacteriales bacterium]